MAKKNNFKNTGEKITTKRQVLLEKYKKLKNRVRLLKDKYKKKRISLKNTLFDIFYILSKKMIENDICLNQIKVEVKGLKSMISNQMEEFQNYDYEEDNDNNICNEMDEDNDNFCNSQDNSNNFKDNDNSDNNINLINNENIENPNQNEKEDENKSNKEDEIVNSQENLSLLSNNDLNNSKYPNNNESVNNDANLKSTIKKSIEDEVKRHKLSSNKKNKKLLEKINLLRQKLQYERDEELLNFV